MKSFITLIVISSLIFFSSFSSFASKVSQDIKEDIQYPIKVAEKHDNSIYINKIDYRNYLVNGDNRIPIPIKYYYDIKNFIVFLGEDNTLYYSNKYTLDIKVLLKDIKTAVSTSTNGDYIYALNKEGDLYRITVDTAETKMIRKYVKTLYSAFNDWVVYKALGNKWWKHYINNTTTKIEHKGSDSSPFIPDTEIGSSISSNRHIVVGPWSINEVDHHDAVTWHGGQWNYHDYTTYSWEYADGISGPQEIYSNYIDKDTFQIVGWDANNLYIAIEVYEDEPSYKKYLKVFQIKPSEKENIHEEDYLDYDGIIKYKYYKCIYSEEIKSEANPWINNLKDYLIDKVSIIQENNTSVNNQWKISIVKENSLFLKDKKVALFEGNGIWIYSKGLVNAVYSRDDSIFLLRNGEISLVKDKITTINWDKAFSLDGWIYLYIDGYYSRFQPNNPKSIQIMNTSLQSPVFESQNVIGFYQNSLCKYSWSKNKLEVISTIKTTAENHKNLIITDDEYIYYNESTKGIERVLKSSKKSNVLSGNMMTSDKFWYECGYIYFINEKDNSLYRVLPNGKNTKKIMDDCIDITFYHNKIYCITHTGVFTISPTGLNKLLVINKSFDDLHHMENISYIENIEGNDNRIIMYLVEHKPDPESEFNSLLIKEVHSITLDYKNDITLPSATNNNIIDSYYYYTDTDYRVYRMGLDGKDNQVLY